MQSEELLLLSTTVFYVYPSGGCSGSIPCMTRDEHAGSLNNCLFPSHPWILSKHGPFYSLGCAWWCNYILSRRRDAGMVLTHGGVAIRACRLVLIVRVCSASPSAPGPGPSHFQHSLPYLPNSSQSPALSVWDGREFCLPSRGYLGLILGRVLLPS